MDRDRGRELWRERKSVTMGKYFYVGDRENKKPKYATCTKDEDRRGSGQDMSW